MAGVPPGSGYRAAERIKTAARSQANSALPKRLTDPFANLFCPEDTATRRCDAADAHGKCNNPLAK
jgi:hypothetical protein